MEIDCLIEKPIIKAQKAEMIEKITDAMVAVEGEATRGWSWVVVREAGNGILAATTMSIGRKPVTAEPCMSPMDDSRHLDADTA